MTPKERTKMLLERLKQKAAAHEAISRESQGRNQFSVGHKVRVSLPLVAIVITLYFGSFFYMKKRSSATLEIRNEIPNVVDGSSGDYSFNSNEDDAELLKDDKQW